MKMLLHRTVSRCLVAGKSIFMNDLPGRGGAGMDARSRRFYCAPLSYREVTDRWLAAEKRVTYLERELETALDEIDTLTTVEILADILRAYGKFDRESILKHPALTDREKVKLIKLYEKRLKSAHPKFKYLSVDI